MLFEVLPLAVGLGGRTTVKGGGKGLVEKVQRRVTVKIRSMNTVLLIGLLLSTRTQSNFIVSNIGSSGPTNLACNPWI